MVERYATGRHTLREALRLLEFQGVISLKAGSGGGPVISSPNASNMASIFMLLLGLNRAPYRVVVELRTAIEPMVCRLAATRIEPVALETLGSTITEMRKNPNDLDGFVEGSRQFHDVIAWSSGNILLACISDAVLHLLDNTAIGIDYPISQRSAIIDAHERIWEGLVRGDEDASEQNMDEHIRSYMSYAKSKFADVFEQPLHWDE
jgi:DNA-binding FadR family transcriptional regulator